MKDYLGNEVQLEDTIVYSVGTRGGSYLIKGKVTRVTDKTCSVEGDKWGRITPSRCIIIEKWMTLSGDKE